MLKKLRIKFTLTYILTTGIILGCFLTWYLNMSETQLRNQSGITFQNNINSIVYKLQSSRVIDNTWLSQMEAGNMLIIHIEDNQKPLLFRGAFKTGVKRELLVERVQKDALEKHNFDIKLPPRSSIDISSVTFEITGEDNEPYQAAAVIIPSSDGWQSLTLLRDLSMQKSDMLQSRIKFFAVITVVMISLSLFGWWFAGKAIQPIEESRKQQTEFVAAASHELRSPLTVLGISTSAFEISGTENEKMRFLNTIKNECKRMSRLVDDLLLLASSDSGNWSFRAGEVEPDTLIINAYEAYEEMIKVKNQSLTLDLPRESLPVIKGDFQRLSQALCCLLDNAVYYTEPGGKIILGACRTKRSLLIYVADNGKGIPDEYKEKVFERFYRMDSSRSKKEHYGLGLSVAKEIIRLHRGKIYVKDTEGSGSTFFMELPFTF